MSEFKDMKNVPLFCVFKVMRVVCDVNNVPYDCLILIMTKYQQQTFQFNGLSKSAAKRRAARLNCCVSCGKEDHGKSKCRWSNTYAQQDLTRFFSLGAIRLKAERPRKGSNIEVIVEDELWRIYYHLIEKAGLVGHPISKLG